MEPSRPRATFNSEVKSRSEMWVRKGKTRGGGAALVLCLSACVLARASQPQEETGNDTATAIRAHDYERAEKLLIDSITAAPGASPLLRVLGRVFFLDGKYLNCASALEKAKAAGLLDEPSRFTLAMAYVNLKQLDWARTELQVLIEANPKRSLYHYWLGRVDFADGKFNSSIESLKTAVTLDPRFSRAYDALGLCYQALGDTGESLRNFSQAVALNRVEAHPSQWPDFDMAELFYSLRQYREAKIHLHDCLRYDPQFPKAHYRLGTIYEKLGDTAAAILELNTAATLDASYAEPYYALARIYRAKGENQQALLAADKFKMLGKHP